MEKCPFCGLDPFEYVDIGIGKQAVAANCCEYGYLLYGRGWSYRKVWWFRLYSETMQHFWVTIPRLIRRAADLRHAPSGKQVTEDDIPF